MTSIIPEALDEQLPSHYDPNVASDVMEVKLLPSKSSPGFSGFIDLKKLRKWDKVALEEVLAVTDLVQRMLGLVNLNDRMNKATGSKSDREAYSDTPKAVNDTLERSRADGSTAELPATPGIAAAEVIETTEQTVVNEKQNSRGVSLDLDAILAEEGDEVAEVISVKSSPKQGFDDEPEKAVPAKKSRRATRKLPVKVEEESPQEHKLGKNEVAKLFDELLSDRLGLSFLKAKPAEPNKQVYFSVGEGGFLVNYHEVIIEKSFIILIRDTRFKLSVQYTPKITIKAGSEVEFFEVTVDDDSDEREEKRQVFKCAYGGNAFRLGCLDCFMLFRGA